MLYKTNHYIPKFILNKFSTQESPKINVIDIIHMDINEVDTKKAFTKENFFDLNHEASEDIKRLEKLFNKKVENKMSQILSKIEDSEAHFSITREEMNIIKKYILIQTYRSPMNASFYNEAYKGETLSKYSKESNESEKDFWKREMLYVLENDWETIIKQKELIGVKIHSEDIYKQYLTFFTTDQEFILTDLTSTTERIRFEIEDKFKNEYLNILTNIYQDLEFNDANEIALNEVNRNNQYIDNYLFIILGPKLAVASVNPLWIHKYKYEITKLNWIANKMESPILDNPKNFKLPKVKYLIDPKHKQQGDVFTYEKIKLDNIETIHTMILNLNEAKQFIGYKNETYIKDYLKIYNELSYSHMQNIKNNYMGFIQLINDFHNKKQEEK
ncbi:MAG: DUF4238 domain-containing protein [Acholeplasmataceae bacterium]